MESKLLKGTQGLVAKKILNDDKTINSRNKNIFAYSPFKDNDVLHVIYTLNNIILLLRNGTCISWGLNTSTLGRRCTDSDSDSYKPLPIKLPTKIVDIACGRKHCLARGANFRVYSWGHNDYGQLGLSGFSFNSSSENELPAEIQTFSNIKIKQICASGNTSFAITEGGNNLYGWGDNENGQLGLNFERMKKVPVPKIIDLGEKIVNEIVVIQKKNGSKSFVSKLHRPASNVSQAMIFFQNKNLYYKEIELISEKEKLEQREEQIKKRKTVIDDNVTQQDMDKLMKEIKSLKEIFETKLENINKKPLEQGLTKNAEIFKSYGVQIEFQKEKEKSASNMLKSLEKAENQIELDILNTSKKEKNSLNEKKMEIKNKKQQIVKIEKLLENVNSGLYEQKHSTLEKHKLIQHELKKVEDKMRRIKDYLNIFENVKNEAKTIIDKKLDKEKIKDLKTIMVKLVYFHTSLKENLIENYDIMNPESESVLDSILKSGENLEDLENDIYDIKIDENNKFGRKAIDCFKNNILLAKMNNFLYEKMLNLSTVTYNKSLEKYFKENINIPQEVLQKINAVKEKYRQMEILRLKEEEEKEHNRIKYNNTDQNQNTESVYLSSSGI